MSSDTTQRIVVLGGGIGGQVAATRLKQKLGGGARVVLVERSPTFTFSPSLLWLLTRTVDEPIPINNMRIPVMRSITLTYRPPPIASALEQPIVAATVPYSSASRAGSGVW